MYPLDREWLAQGSIRLRFGPRWLPAGPGQGDGQGEPVSASMDIVPDELGCVITEFPSVSIGRARAHADDPTLVIRIQIDEWRRGEIDLHGFDRRTDELAEQGSVTVLVAGKAIPRALSRLLIELLTRAQRWVDRRTRYSRDPVFDRVLALHRQLHDLCKPLVRADYNHALDVWQWLVRLCPEAGLAVQIAALFHDIERLVSEADARIEHLAGSYDRFKHAHARTGARMAYQRLSGLGLADDARAEVARLIEEHEHRPEPGAHDPDLALLNDADGLSFFSLNSAGFLDYYGHAHTRRKIAWTLARLGPRARDRLAQVRLRSDVLGLMPGGTDMKAAMT